MEFVTFQPNSDEAKSIRVGELTRGAGGRRWIGGQASDGLPPSVSYVSLLHLLHGLVLRRGIGVLAVGVLRRHVQHEVDGLVVEARRLGGLGESVELLPLLRGLGVRRAPQPLGEPEARGEARYQGEEAGADEGARERLRRVDDRRHCHTCKRSKSVVRGAAGARDERKLCAARFAVC